MSGPEIAALEQRLLVCAPVGRDAALMAAMLREHSIAAFICRNMATLAAELERGSAAVLLTEEALQEGYEGLVRFVGSQQPWSDLPVILLTHRGADSVGVQRALERLGNVILLERPLVVAALASAARSALRARERQYQTRAHLMERERADQRKDEFLATLAHELRNPLAPIRNSLGILRLTRPAGGRDDLCDMMERQVGVMVRLVDDLLEVSRITRGKIELRLQRMDLAEAVAAALEACRPLAEAAGLALSVDVPGGLAVEGDAVRLSQVFSNLLNNAIKYSDRGGRIHVGAAATAGEVRMSVTDTGAGIPPEALPRIFDMFAQAETPGGRQQTGLGIGLTLARSLVEMHGGSISAESEGPGKGSRFTVTLPLLEGRAAAAPAPAPAPGQAARQPGRALPPILVVDDNRDAADSLASLLRLVGAEVRVANDGPTAVREAEAYRPGLILLDLGMPGMDGYEVARTLRGQSAFRDTLIVAVTGWGQERDRRLTHSAGFNYHLVKPVDFDALQAMLDSVAARQSP